MSAGDSLALPARPARRAFARRFLYGLLLPWRLARETRRDPEVRRHHTRVAATQAAITALVSVLPPLAIYLLFVRYGTKSTGLTISLGSGKTVRGDEFTEMSSTTLLATLGTLYYASLELVSWFVIALSRRYHDQIGRHASLAVGLPPEDPEARPKVALDLRWMWRKVKRRFRYLRVYGGALPVFLLVTIPLRMVLPDVLDRAWTKGMPAIWGVYLALVFTLAKSAHSWRMEGKAELTPPFFLRAAERLTKKEPIRWRSPRVLLLVFRWFLPRGCVAFWRLASKPIYPPAMELEPSVWEAMGLFLSRMILGLPFLYPFFRPFFPTAAAALILIPKSDQVAVEEALRATSSATALPDPAVRTPS
ncbi:MAG: hypothetical protein U0271_40615 [Polyangiaceae bacterium]